jgi:antitoxin ParD1/3/4
MPLRRAGTVPAARHQRNSNLAKIAKFDIFASQRRSPMPTRNINLTAEQDAFVEEVVRLGKYQNASEAVRDAVRGLQQRLQSDDLKLQLLRTHLQAGLDALDRGASTEIDDADLDTEFDRLSATQ